MEEHSLEALMQASLIFVVAVAIIVSNLLIIVTYLNFRGKTDFSAFADIAHFKIILITSILVINFNCRT